MSESVVFSPGHYRYVPAVLQYSAGVAAEPGFELERVRFHRPVALPEAFARIEAHLQAIGRPTVAFAQCELRFPKPYDETAFMDFNHVYVQTLARWGLYTEGVNPVARTTVCPVYQPPPEPSMFAFSYTVPSRDRLRPSFVLSGGGDARSGSEPYHQRIVAPGDTSAAGLHQKVSFVVDEMERRLTALAVAWGDAVSTQLYTVQNIGHLIAPLLVQRGCAAGGLEWHYTRPPVVGLEYEMDVRGVARTLVL